MRELIGALPELVNLSMLPQSAGSGVVAEVGFHSARRLPLMRRALI